MPPAKATPQPTADLFRGLRDLDAIQLLLEILNEQNDLFDPVAVPVNLVLESLHRLNPQACQHPWPGSPAHTGLQQRLGSIFTTGVPAIWARPTWVPSP